MKAKTVYRVYRSFHEPSESGTVEYGTFSTEEAAWERAWEAAGEYVAKEYGKQWKPELEPTDNAILIKGAFDWDSVNVRKVTLDEPKEERHVGHT